MGRGTILVTGVGRARGIGAGIAERLAADGWDLLLAHLPEYDERLGYERGPDDAALVAARCRALGVRAETVADDLADPAAPARLADAAGPTLTGLVLSHCESVDSSILDTSLESWDRHLAVNARATWLLVKALGERLPDDARRTRTGRIVALTSDATVHNLPYGVSKGAMDRVVLAAAVELAPLGISANVINPGPIDTGWMDDATRAVVLGRTPAGRLGTPSDTADLVSFLLSPAGGWVTGQLLRSNGGFAVG